MTKNNDVKIINRARLGSIALFTDIGVKGQTHCAEASRNTLHMNVKGWLETSTNGLSND